MITPMTANTFFGLTTASELAKAQNESKNWRLFYLEANETIERFNQENKKLKKDLDALQSKHDALKQDFKEKEIWVEQLEKSNKEQAELIGKQQSAIAQALNEAAEIAQLRNEATVKLAQQRTAIRIAIDNFNLATKDI